MTFCCALLISVCAFANWRRFRSVLCPPVIFSGLWAVILFGLVLSGGDFYPLGAETLLLCFASVLCFSIGWRLVPPHRRRSHRGLETMNNSSQRLYVLRTLDVFLGLFVAALPFYWTQLSAINQASGDPNFLRSVRAEMVLSDTGHGTLGFDSFRYVLPLLILMTLIATVESYRGRKRKWRIVAWIIVSFAYFIPTGSRLAAMVLLVGVLCAVRLSSGRLRPRAVLAACVVFVAIFAFAAIALGKGGSRYAERWENVSGVARSFRLYAFGGIVACDQLIQIGAPTRGGQIKSLRFFYALGNALGLDVDVPAAIDAPVPTPDEINVYSVYYYYFKDFGWSGVVTIFVALGVVLRVLFDHALSGRPEAMVLYSLGSAFLVFTCSGDPFLSGLSSCIQATVEVFLVYNLWRLFGPTAAATRFSSHRRECVLLAKPSFVHETRAPATRT